MTSSQTVGIVGRTINAFSMGRTEARVCFARLLRCVAILVPILSVCAVGQFAISPGNTRMTIGGSVTFTASAPSGATLPAMTWAITPPTTGISITGTGASALLTAAPGTTPPVSGVIIVTATGGGQMASGQVRLVQRPPGTVVIPVIGFEQAGASSAASKQKFYFNFFISRPFPLGNKGYDPKNDADEVFGPRLRWWGNVRIASYPQQVTTGVGDFVTGFATQVAQLKVNQLAQMGEFNTGVEYRIASFPKPFQSIAAASQERMQLGVVAGFGAISPLNPTESLEIFQTPPSTSPQYARFIQQFPGSKNFAYTGFTTPDRDRFYWEYGGGLRLTTHFFDNSGVQGAAPAMVTYTLGQNQLVSGGLSRGLVQRLEGFFPLPLGERFAQNVSILYLFGRVEMRLAAPHQNTPFILAPAASTINGYDPTVNIVAIRSNRDLYTIGVGVDAVKLINKIVSLNNQNKSNSSPNQQ